MINYWPLLGIAVIVAGFALRFNPLAVVAVAAIVTGMLGGLDLLSVVGTLGKGFNDNRYITVIYLVLPVIGLLERYGLQQRARMLIERMKNATAGRLLIAYFLFRQVFAALGLTSVAGHAQTVRPLVAPMAEAAAARTHGELDQPTRERVRAMAAATDNIALFFGEDIFVAIASILLIQGTMQGYGIVLTPFQLSVWAIPTAIAALLVHSGRLLWLDRSLSSLPRSGGEVAARSAGGGAGPSTIESSFDGPPPPEASPRREDR